MNKANYPQMSYDQAVQHCKREAEFIRSEGVDVLARDETAVSVSDSLCYPLEMQEWITPEDYPILHAITVYAVRADNDYTDKDAWEKILQLTDLL